MTEPKTYRLERISDLLQVPMEKRERCVEELLLGLSLHDLAAGDSEPALLPIEFTWTDDDSRNVEMTDTMGEAILSLTVTKENAR